MDFFMLLSIVYIDKVMKLMNCCLLTYLFV